MLHVTNHKVNSHLKMYCCGVVGYCCCFWGENGDFGAPWVEKKTTSPEGSMKALSVFQRGHNVCYD